MHTVSYIPMTNEQAENNFWSRVDSSQDCWLWTGPIRPDGYASFGWVSSEGRFTKYVHRISYEQLIGTIPDGYELDHLCKVRHCVNPDHLEVVTPKENHRRSDQTLYQLSKTHCPKGHPYDENNTSNRADGRRVCKTCHRERMRHNQGFYLRGGLL